MDWRSPTKDETAVFSALLREEFLGRAELVNQLACAVVREADDDGCLDIKVDSKAPRAPVRHRVPVEAEAPDIDGTMIHVLLHVVDGQANELEVFKENGSKVYQMPSPDKWGVLALEPEHDSGSPATATISHDSSRAAPQWKASTSRVFSTNKWNAAPGVLIGIFGVGLLLANGLLSPGDWQPWLIGSLVTAFGAGLAIIASAPTVRLDRAGITHKAPGTGRKVIAWNEVSQARRAQPFVRFPSAPKHYQFLVLTIEGKHMWLDLGSFSLHNREEIFKLVEEILADRMAAPTDLSWNQGARLADG